MKTILLITYLFVSTFAAAQTTKEPSEQLSPEDSIKKLNAYCNCWKFYDSARVKHMLNYTDGVNLFGYIKEYYQQFAIEKDHLEDSHLLGFKEYWIFNLDVFLSGVYKSVYTHRSIYYPDRSLAGKTSPNSIRMWAGEHLGPDGNMMKDTITGTFLIDKDDRIKSASFTGGPIALLYLFNCFWSIGNFTVIASDGKYLKAKNDFHGNYARLWADLSQLTYELKGKKATEHSINDSSEVITIDLTSTIKKLTLIKQ